MAIEYSLSEMCGVDFDFYDVAAIYLHSDYSDIYDYRENAREKYMFYYEEKGRREYSIVGGESFSLCEGEVAFFPDGVYYYTDVPKDITTSHGIVVSFYMRSQNGEEIGISSPLHKVTKDIDGSIDELFHRILAYSYNPSKNSLKLKSSLYELMDIMAEAEKNAPAKTNDFSDILPAIKQIETFPSRNMTNAYLASMCFISEATFLRRFRVYSGGISPLRYRNNLRMRLAEEMANTTRSTESIADALGFYDAAHLCRMFKKCKGHSLKKQE